MAGETLLTFQEMLAAVPDNASQLIQPVDMRNIVIGLSNDVGFIAEETDFVLPVTSGVAVSVLGELPSPELVTNRWELDGNNQLYPDWGSVTVPPGAVRLLNVQCQFFAHKVGQGTDSYAFAITVGGAQVGRTITMSLATDPIGVFLDGEILYDHSVGAPIDITCTGVGTGDDIDITDFVVNLIGVAV